MDYISNEQASAAMAAQASEEAQTTQPVGLRAAFEDSVAATFATVEHAASATVAAIEAAPAAALAEVKEAVESLTDKVKKFFTTTNTGHLQDALEAMAADIDGIGKRITELERFTLGK